MGFYSYRPVEAHQVSQENIDDLLPWCNGRRHEGSLFHHQDRDNEIVLFTRDGTQVARIGDWVVARGGTFVVYTDEGFNASFAPVEETEAEVFERVLQSNGGHA